MKKILSNMKLGCQLCDDPAGEYVVQIAARRGEDKHSIKILGVVCRSCHAKMHRKKFGRPRKHDQAFLKKIKDLHTSLESLKRYAAGMPLRRSVFLSIKERFSDDEIRKNLA